MEFFNDNFKVIQFGLSGVFAVIVFVLLLVFVKRKEFHELKADVQQIQDTYSTKDAHTLLATKVNTLETQFNELPKKSDLAELKGSIDGMEKLLNRIENQVSMLVENEIKG